MTQLQGAGSVGRLCALVGVSRASYYRDWAKVPSGREETELRDLVQRLALAHRFYGYRRVTELVRRQGWPVNRKRIARIMREDNLLALRRAAFRPQTTDGRHRFVRWPNLARRLILTEVNQLWVADITYVRLEEAFVYLAVVLDAFSRKVVGWAMADHLKASLAIEALDMALDVRQVQALGLIHHPDQGVQYACNDYVERLLAHGVQPSMSRVGCPWDNALAESFMKTLKAEEVDGSAYKNLDDAKSSIGEFIQTIYNQQRLHSALRYLSPEEFEASQPNLSTNLSTTPRPAIPQAAAITTTVAN
jgi:transposase InsO family protein